MTLWSTPLRAALLALLLAPTALAAERFEGDGPATLLELPEAGVAPVVALLDGARHEVLVEVYTLASPEVADALARAARRGVHVRVLVEGAPVGGVPADEKAAIATLLDAGATVASMRAPEGGRTRFLNVHAKWIAVDRERALVSTDNLMATSFPAVPSGSGTRGTALILHDRDLAARVADTIGSDLRGRDVVEMSPERGAPRALPPARVEARDVATVASWNATLVLSPDDPQALLRAMQGATTTLDVAQLFATPWGKDESNPFVDGLVEAARRGVRVRLLLDARADAAAQRTCESVGASLRCGRNAPAVDDLQARAAAEGLPLEARLADREQMLHAKLVLIDGRAAYVGSMNWGRASAERNREAGVILESEEGARWLGGVFDRWWGTDEERPLPWPSLAPALALALILPRRRASRGRADPGRGAPRTRCR